MRHNRLREMKAATILVSMTCAGLCTGEEMSNAMSDHEVLHDGTDAVYPSRMPADDLSGFDDRGLYMVDGGEALDNYHVPIEKLLADGKARLPREFQSYLESYSAEVAQDGINITITLNDQDLVIDNPQADPLREPMVFDLKDIPDRPTPQQGGISIQSVQQNVITPDGTNENEQDYGGVVINPTYNPIRITVNTDELVNSVLAQTYPLQVTAVVDEIIPDAVALWADKLKVVPVIGNLVVSGNTCGEATIPAADTANGVANTDLVIYVVGRECNNPADDPGYAYGGPCEYDQFIRPTAGKYCFFGFHFGHPIF